MSQLIIPDDWLIHDLKGDNGEEIQTETLSLLKKVYNKCDKITILIGSPFVSKFHRLLMTDSRPHIRMISKYLRVNFLLNSVKCLILTDANDLPENLKNRIPSKNQYLFQIRQSLNHGKIVTTDESLRNLPNTYLRNEFLREYN